MWDHAFSAATPAAKAVIIDLLAQHGLHERFQVNTKGVLRSIMWDGTIISCPDPEVTRRLGSPTTSIGLVSSDPAKSAASAAVASAARSVSFERLHPNAFR
jgi:hypothetical protein